MDYTNIKKEINLLELSKTIWQRRKMFIKYSIIGLAIGIVLALSLPRFYTASMLMVSESKSPTGKNGISGLAGMMGVNIESSSSGTLDDKIYPYVLKSTPFMTEFIDIPVENDGKRMTFGEYLLYEQYEPWWAYIISAPAKIKIWLKSIGKPKNNDNELSIPNSPEDFDIYCKMFAQTVNIEIDEKNNIINISATTQSPQISAIINDSVFNKLQRYVYEYRTAKVRQTLLSNMKALEMARLSYHKADDAYANVADKNQNLITQTSKIKVERFENEKIVAFGIYQQLAAQVEMDRVKLREETPIATILQPTTIPLIPSSMSKMNVVMICIILSILTAIGINVFRFVISKDGQV